MIDRDPYWLVWYSPRYAKIVADDPEMLQEKEVNKNS